MKNILITILFFTGLFSGEGLWSAETLVDQLPYSGLISESVDLQGVCIKSFRFKTGDKYIFVNSGENFSCYLDYEVDAKNLKAFKRHHIVLGLHGSQAFECVAHSLGLTDQSKEEVMVDLQAPAKKGVYELRVGKAKGAVCSSVKEKWDASTSNQTVLGVVFVK